MTKHQLSAAERQSAAERYASGQETVDAIAEDLGTSRSAVMRAAKALGIECDGRYRVQRSIRDRVDEMKPLDAVDFLLDLCDRLLVDEASPAFVGFRKMGFAPGEARILAELDGKRGAWTSHERLFAISNPAREPEKSDTKVVSVYVCRIRKFFRENGIPVELVNRNGDGYFISVPQGYKWPWEGQQ